MANRTFARLCAAAVVGVAAGTSQAATLISDDFNDGNDNGWTRVDPVGQSVAGTPLAGSYASFDASTGEYRIVAQPSPAQAGGTDNPSRAASLRTGANEVFDDFHIVVTISAFDASKNQVLGILARVRDVGVGTTDGYLLNYNPSPGNQTNGFLQINRIDDEEGTSIGVGDVDGFPKLDPAGDYKLVFRGEDGVLTGELYDGAELVSSSAATDATYADGFAGLLVANTDNGGADATFDNFVAIPEPTALGLLGVAAAGLLVRRRRGA